MSTRSPPWVTYLDSAESAFTAVLKHERQTHERPTEVAKEAMKVLQACGQIRQNTTPKALDNSELDAWRTETLPTLLAFVVYELASHLSLEGLLKGLRENGGAAALSLAIQLTEAKEKDRQKKKYAASRPRKDYRLIREKVREYERTEGTAYGAYAHLQREFYWDRKTVKKALAEIDQE